MQLCCYQSIDDCDCGPQKRYSYSAADAMRISLNVQAYRNTSSCNACIFQATASCGPYIKWLTEFIDLDPHEYGLLRPISICEEFMDLPTAQAEGII